jgi:hypothetical protein
MIILENVDVYIPESSKRLRIKFNNDYEWTNKSGKTWTFKAGWMSDGHSIPGGINSIDRLVQAAFCHDQDCENAITYDQRVQGDKDYRDNMRDLGGSRFVAYRRYLAVRGYSKYLKLKGKLK